MIQPGNRFKGVTKAAQGGFLAVGANDDQVRDGRIPLGNLVPADVYQGEAEDKTGAVQRKYFRMEVPFLIKDKTTLHPFPHIMQE